MARSPLPAVARLAAALLGTLPLLAGAVRVLPVYVAVAAGVAVAASIHSGLLIRMAWRVHRSAASSGLCRGAGFIGLGVLVTGAAAIGAILLRGRPLGAGASAAGPAPGLAAAGLLVSTLLYLLGLLVLPGVVPTGMARVRPLLDGLGLGTCFGYTAWLLVAPPAGTHRLAVGVALTCCTGLAMAVVTGLGAPRNRLANLLCAGGVTLSMAGLAGVSIVLDTGPTAQRLLAVAVPVVLGPAVSLAGARRAVSGTGPVDWSGADEDSVGYPIMAVPIGGAIAATAYHLASGHAFDQVSIMLGLAAGAALATRETFAMVGLRRLAQRVARREAHFRLLIAGSMDVTVVLGDDLVVRWQSPAAARQFGLSDQDVVGRPFVALVHPGDAGAVRERLAQLRATRPGEAGSPTLLSARLRDGFGQWRRTESTVSDQRAVPEVAALVMHLRDVTGREPAAGAGPAGAGPAAPGTAAAGTAAGGGGRVESGEEASGPAGVDMLTGLADRRQLARTVAGMRAVPGRPGALLLIELDEVAAVGEVHGGEAGDAVLVEVGRRLRAVVAGADLATRLGDEMFAIATAHPPVPAFALAARVRDVLGQPFELPGTTVRMAANIGLAELAGAASVGDTLARAEAALRRARQLRSGGIEWYDEALAAALLRRRRLERELPGVVDRGELELLFQPVLDLTDDRPVGADALLRWRHPRLGVVAAADLIPAAEAVDLIDEIGAWLLHRACRQLARWLDDGWDLWLGVQLAACQLYGPEIVDAVEGALRSHRLPAERLIVEVTEQGLCGDDASAAVAQLGTLRSLGVRTALVQYGTGTTPLASLRRLPVDLLKVDRAMFTAESATVAEPPAPGVAWMPPRQRELPPGAPLMDAVVGLARRLGLQVVAEGLDAESQVDVVRAAGCRYGQGELFGRLSPAEHFEACLEAHRSATA
jgi:diguanylate cyclase (GGDEF)-like protein/PAS domain S-box-containing protein